MSSMSTKDYQINNPALRGIARRMKSDAAYRARAESDGRGVLAEAGLAVSAEVTDIRFVSNDESRAHFVIPADPNEALTEADIDAMSVSGGGNGKLFVSSASSIPSCLGSFSSVDTANI